MSGKNSRNNEETLNRRDLLGRGSALALGLLVGGAGNLRAEELIPEEQPASAAAAQAAASGPAPAAVTCAVIGLGDQGRELLTSLSYVPGANIKYVCDTYANAHKRALERAPKATAVDDYKKVLDDRAVQAVWVATPSHLHRQVVLDALQAGKHVYCEAPLASSIDDAKAIALAAKAASPKQIFHAGLQQRTDSIHKHVLQFIRTGALGNVAQTKAGWHKKTSWRRAAPTDERQNALNWRLRKESSGGLMNEIGIHQIDIASWYLDALPVAVSGFGSIVAWKDGREVPDTVQCVLEYPGGIHLAYDATLANSFDGAQELFQGMNAAVMLRGGRAWMFKEADAPALGWEVYAYKENIGDETGIALVADATKLLAEGKEPGKEFAKTAGKNQETDPTKGALYLSSLAFLTGIREGKPTDSGYLEGYTATVTALKAHEAVMSGNRVTFTKEMFEI